MFFFVLINSASLVGRLGGGNLCFGYKYYGSLIKMIFVMTADLFIWILPILWKDYTDY